MDETFDDYDVLERTEQAEAESKAMEDRIVNAPYPSTWEDCDKEMRCVQMQIIDMESELSSWRRNATQRRKFIHPTRFSEKEKELKLLKVRRQALQSHQGTLGKQSRFQPEPQLSKSEWWTPSEFCKNASPVRLSAIYRIRKNSRDIWFRAPGDPEDSAFCYDTAEHRDEDYKRLLTALGIGE